MSLSNAALLRVDAPPAPAPGGGLAAYAAGAALAVPCILDAPTFQVQRLIDDLKLDSTAVLYVQLSDWAAAGAQLLDNAQVLVCQTGQPQQLLRIDRAAVRVFGGISHVMCFVRSA